MNNADRLKQIIELIVMNEKNIRRIHKLRNNEYECTLDNINDKHIWQIYNIADLRHAYIIINFIENYAHLSVGIYDSNKVESDFDKIADLMLPILENRLITILTINQLSDKNSSLYRKNMCLMNREIMEHFEKTKQ